MMSSPASASNNPAVQMIAVEELMDHVKLSVIKAFTDDAILEKMKTAIAPLILPLKEALNTTNTEIKSMKSQLAEKDSTITSMACEIADLQVRNDDLEQQGRKGSVRVFGVPVTTEGTKDTKILSVLNKQMKLDPPIVIEDLEVIHRLGKPRLPPDDAEASEEPKTVSPIIVKFASRRVKSRVMENRKKLKDNPCIDDDGREYPVYIQDDLTKRRANLAFLARQSKRNRHIMDTWIAFSKVMVKDNYGRISTNSTHYDLRKLEPN